MKQRQGWRRRALALTAAALIGMAALGGCDRPGGEAAASGPPAAYPYTAVATVGMVADVVGEVAGERAKVRSLMAAGADPHLYQPTRNDIAALDAADIVFYVGLLLEGKMDGALKALAGRKPVHAVAETIDPEFLLSPPEFEGHPDPHVWMDVKGWMHAVSAVADALAKFDPANAEAYHASADNYLARLEELDAYARERIASIPEESRVLITAHDAFNYFGRAYSLEVIGIQGISTDSEAGVQTINRLVDLIVDRDIRAVFVESSVSEANVRALIEGAASRGRRVAIGGTLYSDAMGPDGTYEGTYVGMIDHNVTTIVRALGGEAPAGGIQGKLARAEAR